MHEVSFGERTSEARARRILAVDDDEGVRRAYARLLRGFEVVALETCREALEWLARGERFDVLLCDMMMPHMTGAELHAGVRQLEPLLASRTIFVTGGGTTAAAATFLEETSQPVLTKPFLREHLVAAIERVLLTS